MNTCVCKSSKVVTLCDRCKGWSCMTCSKLLLPKSITDEIGIVHDKCLTKKERLQ
jgi:hypothetical protein